MGTEDFSTFTKAGADQARITTTADRASWTTLRRDDQAYLYKDYGVGYFAGEFTIDFDLRFSDIEAGDASNRPFVDVFVLDTVIGTEPNQGASAISVRPKQNAGVDDTFWFRLAVAGGSEDNLVIRNINTTYYCRVIRSATNVVTLSVYSDAARNNLIFTLGTRSTATALRYVLTAVSMESGNDPADHSTGYIENLDLDPLLQSGSANLPCEFIVRQPISAASVDLFCEFIVRHAATRDLPAQFEVGQGSENLPAEFIVRHVGTPVNLLAEFTVRHADSEDLLSEFTVRQETSVDLLGEFIVRRESSVDLAAEFVVRHVGTPVDLFGEFIVRQEDSEDLLGEFVVRHETSVDLLAEFIARHKDSEDLKSEFIVRPEISVDLLGEFIIRHEDAVDLAAAFVVRHVGTPVNLAAEFVVRHVGTPVDLVAEFVVRKESSVDLKTAFTVTHIGTPVDLFGEFIVRQEDAEDLLGAFTVRHETSVDLAAEFVVRHVGTPVDLFGEFTIRHTTSVDLLGEFIVRKDASEDLAAEFIIRRLASVDLPCSFEIGQGSENLPAEFIVRQERSVNLLGEFIVRHATAVDLPAQFEVGQGDEDLPCEFIVRQESSVDLLGIFDVQQLLPGSIDLPGEFVIRHSTSLNLPAEFIIRHETSVDLFGKFDVRHPYPFWTDRQLLNGVVHLSEVILGDAMLEEVIGGVMNDIRSWLIANEYTGYVQWSNIEDAPLAIRRATTYGTVASMYARRIFSPQDMAVRVSPVDFKLITTHESAMDYWEGKMEEALESFLPSGEEIWVDTADEEPVFTMDDVPHDPEFPG